MRTYTIELRCDFMEEDKYELVLELVRKNAREMLTMALMLKDKREPQISFSSGDMFETNKDITIISPDELENTGGE